MGQNVVIGKVFRMQERSGWRAMDMITKKNKPSRFSKAHPVFCCMLCLAGLNQTACTALWPDMAVSVFVPPLPPVWSTADGWELDWRSLETIGDVCLAAPGDTLVMFLPRTSSAAIRCRPVFGSGRGQPYGAIWPLGSGSPDSGSPDSGSPDSGSPAAGLDAGGSWQVLSLDAGGGLAAELAFRLFQGGWDAGAFNLRRFSLEAELRMADPWDSDLAVLARAVAEGRFRADYLTVPVRTQVAVYGLAGLMAPDSPWATVLEPDAQGQVVLAVSTGIHRWFGNGQELVVSVSSDGLSEWILRGSDGREMQKVLP